MTKIALAALALALLAAPDPARAECLGSCMDGIVGAFVAMLVYGGIGIVVMIMLVREKWRRGGLRLLVATVVVAYGLPLISQAWQTWRLQGTESREVAGAPPALQGRVPLLIDGGFYLCGYGPCAPVLWSMGEAGAYGVPYEALAERDLSQPIAIADLPLELWQHPNDGTADLRRRVLTPAERQAAAAKIDYLVLAQQIYATEGLGAVEAALRQGPVADLKSDEIVHLIMAPLAAGRLALGELDFDVLDLTLDHDALAFPLAPYNRQSAANETASSAALVQLYCPEDGAMEVWSCKYELE